MTNTNNYWNTKLASVMASVSQVTIFDVKSIFAAIVANPAAYGIANINDYLGKPTFTTLNTTDQFMWCGTNGFHPSAALHRILGINFISELSAVFPGAVLQNKHTLQLLGNVDGNGQTASFNSPSGFQVLPYAGGLFPQLVTSQDARLSRADLATVNPSGHRRIFTDFDSGTWPDPKYAWTTNVVSAGSGAVYAATANYGDNTFGEMQLTVNATTAVYGANINSVQFRAAKGPARFQFRAWHTISSGCTLLSQFGFCDSLTTLANGVWFEIIDTNGVITANLVGMIASSRTAMSLGTIVWASGGLSTLFEFDADADWKNFSVYFAGSLIKFGQMYGSGASAINLGLYPFFQGTQTLSGGSFSRLYVDLMCADVIDPRL